MTIDSHGYWNTVWQSFKRNPLGIFGAVILTVFFLIAIWAPFLACSKPLFVVYRGEWYFPLFRYLLSSLFFTKKIDIFFNIVGILFLPFLVACFLKKKWLKIALGVACIGGFFFFGFFYVADPAVSVRLNQKKQEAYIDIFSKKQAISPHERFELPSWAFELRYLNNYAKLNLILNQRSIEQQERRLNVKETLAFYQQEREHDQMANLTRKVEEGKSHYQALLKEEATLRKAAIKDSTIQTQLMMVAEETEQYEELENELNYLIDRREWLQNEIREISYIVMPLIRPYHWEEDVGGDQRVNAEVPFMELTRINRKDLVASLIFGSRISLLVGFGATFLALAIGLPLGLAAGSYGGAIDIVLCRFVEVWEAMPAFFMLMLLVTLLQTKAIFIVILVIAVFSWTTPFRFVRAESFRQKEMLYIEATKALGFSHWRTLCMHILPNSLIAVMALLPFDIMAAITREAGLAFLGLGEEQSCSWGVLMDEGRGAFPAESMLLWPPAIVLTILLVVLAFVGEALQKAANPKTRNSG